MAESKSPSISRRFFLIIILGAIFGFVAWIYRRSVTGKSIQNFFGLDDSVQTLIDKELESLKQTRLSWWAATIGFFALVDWGMRIVVPRRIQFRVINYWSWRIFSHRSIAWKYVNYPSVGDDPICDGLIRPS